MPDLGKILIKFLTVSCEEQLKDLACKKEYLAVAIRHPCIMILERWTMKKMSYNIAYVTILTEAQWRKRNAVRPWNFLS